MGGQPSAIEAEGSKLPGMHMARSATAAIHIDGSPSEIWETVADVRRQQEWSCESTKCEWIPPADHATAGAKFRGYNRRGFRRWTRECEVTEVEPGRVLSWRTLTSRLYPDSTDWWIELRPDGDGTEVRESYKIRSISRGFEIFMYWFNPGHRERSADLESDLRRLKAYVEGSGHP
jgi:Polyketide cyclase / dehydrase and lipid transport